MKILALIGSPRKASNTDILVSEILKGAEEKGYMHGKIYLYDYEILPCFDCRKCKQGDFACPLKDGMQEIYPRMDEVDVLIFGTPNYWYGPTAKMKLLLDRMRPYVANGKLKGKQALVVVPAAEGAKACGPLLQMFRLSFDYIGVELTGEILVTAYEKGEIKENQAELKKAFELGASL